MISLEAATRTCKVDQGSAARIESDRFLNPQMVVCPTWNGRDLAGREVNPNTFYTKRAGCNSAADRVMVENNLRPQYSEYINLDVSEGIRGQMYGNNMNYQNAGRLTRQMHDAQKMSGHFGGQFSMATNSANCSYNNYERGVSGMGRQHTANASKGGCGGSHTVEGFVQAPNDFSRKNAAANAAYRSCRFTQMSGM